MPQRAIDLSNSDNWRLVWEKLTIANRVVINPEKHHPIEKIEMPVQLESSVLAVLVENQQARSTWRYAGRMTQSVQTGIVGFGGSNDAEIATSRKLWLNQVIIYVYPQITTTYSLKFEIPKWFEEVSITVWEYIGQDLESLHDVLVRIENKLDAINR